MSARKRLRDEGLGRVGVGPLLLGKELVFPRSVSGWDDPPMSEKKAKDASESSGDRQAEHGHDQDSHGGSPSTQQMCTVGRRRRNAEEKLERHLDEARHKSGAHGGNDHGHSSDQGSSQERGG
jgi:hypothetical protein